MVEPFSVGALGARAATEGIKLLYGQAGEVLRRWRDRKSGRGGGAGSHARCGHTEVLEGKLEPLKVDFDAVERPA